MRCVSPGAGPVSRQTSLCARSGTRSPSSHVCARGYHPTLVRMAPARLSLRLRPGPRSACHHRRTPFGRAVAAAAGARTALALSSSAWAFFLFSYQVHEKSVLLPLAPLPFLADSITSGSSPPRADSTQHLFVAWLGALGAFSMWPLLMRDGLGLAYVACLALHALASVLCAEASPQGGRQTPPVIVCFVFAAVTIFGAVALHVAWLLVPPPSRLPDLYPSLIALYCGKSRKDRGRCRPALTSVARCRCAMASHSADHPRAVAGNAALAPPDTKEAHQIHRATGRVHARVPSRMAAPPQFAADRRTEPARRR